MDQEEFQNAVMTDLTALKVSIARVEERLKPLQEAQKSARKAFYSAAIAVLSLLVDLILRR